MPRLIRLSLESNPLGHVPPVLYDLPPMLLTLELSNTSLSILPAAAWQNWKQKHHLLFLHLNHNPALSSFPMEILELKRLTHLRLSRTGISVLPTNLTLLQNLYELDVSSCQLKTLPALDEIPSLTVLNLANNSLTHPPTLFHPERFRMIEWSLNPFCDLPEHRDTLACTASTCSPDCSTYSMAQYYCRVGCINCQHPQC